jgi:hypothetical protein
MKPLKLFLIIVPTILLIIFLTTQIISHQQINPVSNQNDFYSKLNNALQTSQLNPINLTIKDFQNEVEFYLQNNENNQTKVILSNQKDPYWQIASLQDLFKTAKINNKQINLIDLSINHPYATLQNN